MKRRTFIWRAAGFLALPLAGMKRMLPARCLEALRARQYPGPVIRRRDDETRTVGKWAG